MGVVGVWCLESLGNYWGVTSRNHFWEIEVDFYCNWQDMTSAFVLISTKWIAVNPLATSHPLPQRRRWWEVGVWLERMKLWYHFLRANCAIVNEWRRECCFDIRLIYLAMRFMILLLRLPMRDVGTDVMLRDSQRQAWNTLILSKSGRQVRPISVFERVE